MPNDQSGISESTARMRTDNSNMSSTSNNALSRATMPLNIVECPSTEIRHMVYSLLGFPVGTHVWLDCPGLPRCLDKSHIIFHEDAKWPMTWHAPTGHFEIRKTIEQLTFLLPRKGANGPFENLQVTSKMGDEKVRKSAPMWKLGGR